MISPLLTNEYESEILDLIDNRDEYTRSDLQGVVIVLVNKIMKQGYQILKAQEKMRNLRNKFIQLPKYRIEYLFLVYYFSELGKKTCPNPLHLL